jgi:hypothetical protein
MSHVTFTVSKKTDTQRHLCAGDIVTLADALSKQNVKARYVPCRTGETWEVGATFDGCVDRVECGEILDQAKQMAQLEHVHFSNQRVTHDTLVTSIF